MMLLLLNCLCENKISFLGECFSGMDAHLTYDKHGEGESCVHGETKDAWGKCTRDDKSCSGEARTNYVYRVAPTGRSS